MSLFSWFAKREKAPPPRKEEDSAEDLALYSGIRVEVTTADGRLLFVAKLLGIRGNRAELHQYSETAAFQGEPPLPVRIRGYSDRDRKAVYMEGLITPLPQNIWQVEELTISKVGNDRAFFRLETNLDATATMFSGLELGEKPCRLLNISVGGVCLGLEKRYDVGDKFLLRVRLTPEGELLALRCQMLRILERRHGYFEYGCRFPELEAANEERILRYIFAAQER